MKQYLLGIDIGTSGCKAALFDKGGAVICQATKPYKVFYPQSGFAEQNPDDWWAAVCLAIKEILDSNGIKSGEIAGIGVDGQSWSAIAVDKDGNVLCPTPIWMDTRAADICEELDREIGEESIFNLCGNPLKPSYTSPKILWYKKHRPEMYSKIHTVLQSNSFIVYRLTGVITQEKSQGYGWHCFDMRKNTWDMEMCGKMGISTSLLPDILDCHQIAGTVTEKAAELTGLMAGTPVVAGGLDAACATLGAGVLHAGETQEQGGQAGGMSICIDKYNSDIRLILGSHVVPGKWLLQGGTVGGGGVIEWFDREFGSGDFKVLDALASEINPGADGMVFLPYMAGERSPIWDMNARGVYYGINFAKTKGHFIRSSLEGVAFSLKHNLEVAEQAGASVEKLFSVGGAANSKLWTQIKSDITGKPIEVPSSDTAATLGAAMLAGVGTGLYKDFEEAVGSTVKITKQYEPNPLNLPVYSEAYQTYLELYKQLKPIMDKRGHAN